MIHTDGKPTIASRVSVDGHPYSAEVVQKYLDGVEPGTPIAFNVLRGESAWNPASTKRALHGPARVSYVRHPDGGIDATERDL